MIVDFANDEPLPARPEVLIMGAGAVGIVLAVALSRAGKRVLLCESGGRTAEGKSQALNRATVGGRPHAGITDGRARVLGGTTTLWGGQLIAFRSIDFQARPWLDLPAWPIDREVLVPYYEQCAALLGLPLKGDDEDKVWSALGLSPPDLGSDVEFVLTRWLKETNLARMFAADLNLGPNLTVALHATATQFNCDSGGCIKSVILRSPDGGRKCVEADQFVVAAGTIEANRLMLATAHSNPSLPWSQNPFVGTAFQDHFEMRAATVEPIDRKRFNDTFDNIFIKGFKYNPKLTLSSQKQFEKCLTNVGGVMTFDSSIGEHLSNVKLFIRALRNGALPSRWRTLPRDIIALLRIWYPLIVRYLKDKRAFNPADRGIGFRVHCEQRPMNESRISLDLDKLDENGVPFVRLDWQIDGAEIDSIAAFCEEVSWRLERAGLARLEIDPRILARDKAVIEEARDTNHHCGGLRMAHQSNQGVVDENLKVYGTSNLYVAGAAVFPSSSFANPTFTAMALALRLADRIKRAN